LREISIHFLRTQLIVTDGLHERSIKVDLVNPADDSGIALAEHFNKTHISPAYQSKQVRYAEQFPMPVPSVTEG